MTSNPDLQTARPSRRSAWKPVLWIVIVLGLGWYASVCARVARQQWRDEARPADTLVVFGAAQYDGRPSPIFKARLDHAFELYQRRVAPYVIVTGGYGDDPQFSEGGVGRDYLVKRGVPEAREAVATQGRQLALAVASIAAFLDPEAIVLGGRVGQNLDLLEAPLMAALREVTPMRPTLVAGELGEEAVVRGAVVHGTAVARELVFSQRVLAEG